MGTIGHVTSPNDHITILVWVPLSQVTSDGSQDLKNGVLTSPETSTDGGHQFGVCGLDVCEGQLLELQHLAARNPLFKLIKVPARQVM